MAQNRPELQFSDGSRPPIALEAAEVVIGRGPGCTHVLDVAGVAPRHARIRLDPSGAAWVEDLETRTGTLCNGQHVEGRARLADGDRLEIGITTLVFRAGGRAATLPPVQPSKAAVDSATMVSGELPQAVKDLLAQHAARPSAATGAGGAGGLPGMGGGAGASARGGGTQPFVPARPPVGAPAPSDDDDEPRTVEMRVDPRVLAEAARQAAAASASTAGVVGTPDPEPVDNRTMQMEAPDFAALGLPLFAQPSAPGGARPGGAGDGPGATPMRATRLGMPIMSPQRVTAADGPIDLGHAPGASAAGAPPGTAATTMPAPATLAPAWAPVPPSAPVQHQAPQFTAGQATAMFEAPVGYAAPSTIAPSLPGMVPPSMPASGSALPHTAASMSAPGAAALAQPQHPPSQQQQQQHPYGVPQASAGQATAMLEAPAGYAAPSSVAFPPAGTPGGFPSSPVTTPQMQSFTPVSTPAVPAAGSGSPYGGNSGAPLQPGAVPYTPQRQGAFGSISRALTFLTQMLTLGRAHPTLLRPLVYNVAISTAASLVLVLPLFFLRSAGAYQAVQYGGLLLLYFIDYFCNGLTAALVFDQVTTGHASVADALPRVKRAVPGIATFAAGSALLDAASTYARERNDALSRILLGILYKVWTTATYIILPAMVIEGVSFGQAFRRSKALMAQDPTGVGAGVVALSIVSYVVGFVCFGLAWTVGGLMAHLHPAIGVFFFLAFFNAYWAVSGWMKIAYSTCFYLWASECQRQGSQDPSLAPAPLREALQAA